MKKRVIVFVFMLALVLSVPVFAADFDFSGNFVKDNDVVSLYFTVGASSNITVFSSSWLYGDPPAGSGPGGFDMMLGIWTSSGSLVNFQDDGHNVGSTLSNGISYDHGTWDSYYNVNLTPGNYIATVTQYNNFNLSGDLSDGFIYDGNPNFTYDNSFGGATQPFFNGVWDSSDPRTSYWQFHLLGVESASGPGEVPEPATMLLLGLGLMGVAGIRRKITK
jgi:hypothetical protein